jgi:hypothetical protein
VYKEPPFQVRVFFYINKPQYLVQHCNVYVQNKKKIFLPVKVKNKLRDVRSEHAFKGTVSPDIGLHFSFWKIKLVLSAGPFMV